MTSTTGLTIRLAALSDLAAVQRLIAHLPRETLREKISRDEVLIVNVAGQTIGVLSWGYFWDKIPFMYNLWLEALYRRQGIGRQLVTHWEDLMRARGHDRVLTSTQSDEDGQHFYRALGYVDCGALLLPDEPLEIILRRQL
jgi:ribosomal protein S18 acetylase RimI-like enzyme